ncbi:MAG: hypothetical protein JWM36_2624 [Hyphomicrobiales bacterium]|nr:hypothetical protein [Hyphomicrobiales bacterium]
MIDYLRIHVLWATESKLRAHSSQLISTHFDGIGMERDGVAYRIPVRFRSESWSVSGPPLDVDLSAATHNAVVLLHDDFMHEEAALWGRYVANLQADMAARGNADVYIPFGSPTRDPPLQTDIEGHIQYARRDIWQTALTTPSSRDTRLLLHLVFTLRQHLRSALGSIGRDEPLFVSHAKSDGDSTARAIVDYVNNSGHDVPLETFYDAMELSPGDDFKAKFDETIGRGTLLAIVSDVYDSRPWCVYELTSAKRARRPIVLADVGRGRISRTYPYGANLPKVRLSLDRPLEEWIEPLLVETLSEGLRCDLFEAQAQRLLDRAGILDALVLPRPPELFDIIDRAAIAFTIVYPDPPLARIESDLLRKCLNLVAPGAKLVTLSELG